jgi:hypothetical protein
LVPQKELLDDLRRLPLHALRPTWLTAGAVRLGVLCLFIVAIGMARPRLGPHEAGLILIGGGVGTLVGALAFLAATRRHAARSSLLDRSERVMGAVFLLLRKTGLPFLGLTFFLFWTFVYLGVWWFHPAEAFTGLDPRPRFADFFYYSVSTAFISPPQDIFAHSRGARSATMIEMLTGFALLAAYPSSFVDWHGRRQPGGEPREPKG